MTVRQARTQARGSRILLLSGLGPAFYNGDLLAGTLFDAALDDERRRVHHDGLRLEQLVFDDGREERPLLRHLPGRGNGAGATGAAVDKPAPHLTTWTLQSILVAAGQAHEAYDLADVWAGREGPDPDGVDIVLLSTTFIWRRHDLTTAIAWVRDRFPDARLVLGGQYSNLKFTSILERHPEVACVVRGDAELALPLVVGALRNGGDLAAIPNLVFRAADGALRTNRVEYVDLDDHASPSLGGEYPVVPYESMRGCPFRCKFCSFPHASPEWRYKSARKIAGDWAGYAEDNGATLVRAYDSTFATPPSRLRELLDLLPAVGVGWEAFARANVIKSAEIVERLAASHCRLLTFGFESMSARTLEYMKKQVRPEANRLAFELLQGGDVGYRAAFMVGYPGETPDDFAETKAFLAGEYDGQFLLNVFSLMDETMPVWDDAARFRLRVDDLDDPDAGWSHSGMDLPTARALMRSALGEVRWGNDRAVHLLWQQQYERPLVPHRTARQNLWIEKLVERLGMAADGASSPTEARLRARRALDGLATEGVRLRSAT